MSRRPKPPGVHIPHHATVADADTDADADVGPGPGQESSSVSQSWDGYSEDGAEDIRVTEAPYDDEFVISPSDSASARRPNRNAGPRLRQADRPSARGRGNAGGNNTRASERAQGGREGTVRAERSAPGRRAPRPPTLRGMPYQYMTIPEEETQEDYYFPPARHNVMSYGGPGIQAAPLVMYRRNSRPTPVPGVSYGDPYELPHPGPYTPYPNLRTPNPPPTFTQAATGRRAPPRVDIEVHEHLPNQSPRSISPAPTHFSLRNQNREFLEMQEGLAKLKAEAAARAEAERREQFREQIRRDAEAAMQRRFEDMREAQEMAKKQIEKARMEAEEAAMKRVEEKRKRDAEEARMLHEQRLRMERDIMQRFEAEQKAKEEAQRAEAQRMEEMMKQAKEMVMLEMEAERERAKEREEERERLRAEIRSEIRAEEARRRAKEAARLARERAAASALTRHPQPTTHPEPPPGWQPGTRKARPPPTSGRRPPSVPEPPIASTDEEFMAESSDAESGIYSPREADLSDRSSSGSSAWRARERARRKRREERRDLRLIREELVDPIVYALSGRLAGHAPPPFARRPPPPSWTRDEARSRSSGETWESGHSPSSSTGDEFRSRPLDELSDSGSADDETVTQRSYRRTGRRRDSRREYRRTSHHPRVAGRALDGGERTARRLARGPPPEEPSGERLTLREDGEGLSPLEDAEELSPREGAEVPPPQKDGEEPSPEDSPESVVFGAAAAEEVAPESAASTAEDHIAEEGPKNGDDDDEEATRIGSELTDDTAVGEGRVLYAPDPPDASIGKDSGYDDDDLVVDEGVEEHELYS